MSWRLTSLASPSANFNFMYSFDYFLVDMTMSYPRSREYRGVIRGTLYPILRVRTGELRRNPIRGINMSNYPAISSNLQNPRKSPKIPENPHFFPPLFWGPKNPKKRAKKPLKKGGFSPPPVLYQPLTTPKRPLGHVAKSAFFGHQKP